MHDEARPRLIRDIAQSQQISEKYISRLVIDLRRAHLIRSVRGINGGFHLAKKPEEITQEEKDDKQNTEKQLNDERQKRKDVLANYAKDNSIVHQLIDLSLLQNGMLKGAALDQFLKRSIDLIK